MAARIALVLAQQVALQLLLQFGAVSIRPPAACGRPASVAGDIELRHEFAQSGMLSSRSIMVGTLPKRATACAIKIPYRGGDRVIVRVDQMAAQVAVAGEMKLAHPLLRYGLQIARADRSRG